MNMNSFTLTAVGNLARNPEHVAKGEITYTRFCLVGNDYAGKDEEGASREIVTSLWFVAFGALGEAIAHHSRKGDQLFVEARVRANNWTDKQGEKQFDHSFVVQGFRWGAPGKSKRDELLCLPRPGEPKDGNASDFNDTLDEVGTKAELAPPDTNIPPPVEANGAGGKSGSSRAGRKAALPAT
jgi:single-strand DNA-binding protein